MNKAFSLLEIIIVLIITSICISFFLIKSKTYIDSSIKTKIKSDVALIRNGITKQKTKNILLKNYNSFNLDNGSSNMKNIKLFTKILEYPVVSTNDYEKEIGKWIKNTNNIYKIYYNTTNFLEYKYEKFKFKCVSSDVVCEEFE